MTEWIKVTAIVRPYRVDTVCDALLDAGLIGITITDVDGRGQQLGYSTLRSGVWYQSRSHPKVQLETVIEADRLAEVLEILGRTARTGEMGDGKIWISAPISLWNIRTGKPEEESGTAPSQKI